MNKKPLHFFIAFTIAIGVLSTNAHAAKVKEPTAEELALEARVAPHRKRNFTGTNTDDLKTAAARTLSDYGFFITESNQVTGSVTGVRIVEMQRPQVEEKKSRNQSSTTRSRAPKKLNMSVKISVAKSGNNQLTVLVEGTYNGQTKLTDMALLDQIQETISHNAIFSQAEPLAKPEPVPLNIDKIS